MSSKIIKIVLNFLLDEAKPRHKVTEKIKNYSSSDKAEAISELISNKMIELYELESKIGRKPVMIKLTKKGIEEASKQNNSPSDKTIWSI